MHRYRCASLPLLVLLAACDASDPARPPPRYPGPPPAGPPPSPPPANLAERRPEDIARVVEANTPRLSACYQRSESFMTNKSGTVTVFFDIEPGGRVSRATEQPPPGVAVPGSPLADPKLVQCLVQGMSALRFDPARDSTAASWTFRFSP
ncbi:MAG: AgmX/PglI C-terminal domain-containing protein [Myxococcales bacterium]|nr:AgmX/PglI C-terminal domain-containing protein [Myxococcales bacterium]